MQATHYFAARQPWLILLLAAAISVFSWLGLSGLTERSDFKIFVDDDHPGMLELTEVESIFGENSNIFITVAPEDGDIFNATNLSIIQELTDAAWQTPYAQRVDSLTNFQYTTAEGDELIVDDLVPYPITPEIIAKAKAVAPTQKALHGLLISEAQDVASVNISLQYAYERSLTEEQADSGDAVFAMLDDFRARYPTVQFLPSGSVAVDYTASGYSQQLAKQLVPLMLLLMVMILLFTLRSGWGTVCTAVIVVLTGSITMGIFGWFKLEVDAVAQTGPIVIMTLAVADAVHVIAGTLNALGHGKTKLEAITASLKLNMTPVFLTSLTTVLGVITFAFAESPPLRKLGVIIALGVTVAFILSVTVLPALLALSPIKAPKRGANRQHIFMNLGEWVIRHYRKILPVAVIFSIGMAALIPRLAINESVRLVFEEGTELRLSMDVITANLAGSQSMDVAILSDTPGAINQPETLAMLDRFSDWAMQQPEINHISTIADTVKTINQNLHGGDPQWHKLPESTELTAQYLLLYELSLPYGLDLNNQINLDKSGTRVTVMLKDITSSEVVSVKRRIVAWFKENSPESRAMPASMSSLIAEISYQELIPSMMGGGIIAIFTVSLVLFFALRSWKFGLLGMITNIVPIAVAYGMWSFSHGFINFAIASVAGICLGVVVDFAVHFLNKYQQGLKQSGSSEGGVRYAFEHVATPLWITMIVLASGFWVMTLSPFGYPSDIGLLTGAVIVIAFVFDLLALPSFLLFFSRQKQHNN